MTKETKECFECGTERPIEDMYEIEVYDSPFDEKPRTIYLCRIKPDLSDYHHSAEDCLELLYDASWADFRYFDCAGCGRTVCEQNPHNGWHVQYRRVDGEQLCLRCYEQYILNNGIDREKFEEGHLPGMFFSRDNREPLDAGYELIETKFIGGHAHAGELCQRAIELIDSGHQVVIGYESLAIGGSEGTVSLFAKEIK